MIVAQSVPDILKPGWSVIGTSYGSGPYRVVGLWQGEDCQCGCYDCFYDRHHEGCERYEVWSVICVSLDAVPNRDGSFRAADRRYLNGYFVADGEIRNKSGDRIIPLETDSPPPKPIQVSLFAQGV